MSPLSIVQLSLHQSQTVGLEKNYKEIFHDRTAEVVERISLIVIMRTTPAVALGIHQSVANPTYCYNLLSMGEEKVSRILFFVTQKDLKFHIQKENMNQYGRLSIAVIDTIVQER